jgi:predicted ATPase/class 3 adenylate cyclase
MARQPSGTVTFLFTDIEGSTRLLAELGPERYSEALDAHRQVMRAAFEHYDGYEVDCEGDAFFVAFGSAGDGLAAASEAQCGLAAHAWPDGHEFRVRMGLHTGEPLLAPPKYVGIDVHVAARIMAAGHGGQVLLSQSTRDHVDVRVRSLGEHRLKDLSEAQQLFQLGEGEFPPLRTLYRTNLPVPPTPFLGRERELRQVKELLLQKDTRLLTLTGPGGTGKTRLALQAVADVADEYPDGVFWVPLAPLREPELVLETAADALGAREQLFEHLAARRVLVVLDNFEQLIAAAPEMAALLDVCPGLDLVVTSRERLRLAAEHEWPVPPLERSDATSLFAQRARAVGADPVTNGVVAELCARLDDLPLALELAAARTRLFSPEQLLERLSQRLDLLKGGRDADPRQQTLRATIEWSYDLLTRDEQALFARLAVFAGGFTLEAAEDVCQADTDALAALLDKSLIRRRGDRFWMLETIREYASERLAESGETDDLDRKLFQRLLRQAEMAEFGRQRRSWLKLFQAERENVRRALTNAQSDQALRLAASLSDYWFIPGNTNEGRTVLAALLERGLDAPKHLRARGSVVAARLAIFQDDYDTASQLLTLADRLFAPEAPGRAEVPLLQGWIAFLTGELERAEALLKSALEEARRTNDRPLLARALRNLATVERRRSNEGRATELLEESLALARESGDESGVVAVLADLAWNAACRGDYAQAERLATNVLQDSDEDLDYALPAIQHTLALALVGLRRPAEASAVAMDALHSAHAERDVIAIAANLEVLAGVSAACESAPVAARLYGAAHALLSDVGADPTELWLARHAYNTFLEEARRQLGHASWQALTAEGASFGLEKAVEYAIDAVGEASFS